MNTYLTQYTGFDGLIYSGPQIQAENEIEARLNIFLDDYYLRFRSLRVIGRLVSTDEGIIKHDLCVMPGGSN